MSTREPLVVVGITGPARSGKDTVAKILASHHGFTRVALADGIRAAFNNLSGPTWELHKDWGGFNGYLPRQSMQEMGTECRMDLGNRWLWTDVALASIRYGERYHPRRLSRFVIPDIRFPHEHSRIKGIVEEWGGTFECWRVHRDGPAVKGSHHSSETSIDDVPVDVHITNYGLVGNLVLQVDQSIIGLLAQLPDA